MNFKILMLVVFSAVSGSAFSQVREGIDKAIKDPKRAEGSAKADVRVLDKTVLSDSAAKASGTTAVPGKRKKKKCKSR